jgi:WD40 repeat protein
MTPEQPASRTASRLAPGAADDLLPKAVVPDHEVLRRIGRGAYGEVWLARNVLGAYRAIKVVHRESFRDERSYEREFRGIQVYEPISRTNDGLLDVLQAGRNDAAGYYYYVMELADDTEPSDGTPRPADPPVAVRPGAALDPGDSYSPKTLATATAQRGRLPPMECVQLGLNLTLALGHLHRHKLIHRDIKPSNIIFVQGIPKLADVGLVTSFDGTCSFVGTEGFIAPEGPTSPRADLFSLGKVLYEISTGKDRKEFPEPASALGRDGEGAAMAELNAVILRMCAPDPNDRYQTAEDVHADLALLNSGRSVKWRRLVERRLAFARKAGAVVGLIAGLTTAGYLYQARQTRAERHLQAVMQVQRGEDLMAQGDTSGGLAELADCLRRQGDRGIGRVAAERIMAALEQRRFPLLAAKPIVVDAEATLVRLSPDGRLVAVALQDHRVQVWDLETGEEVLPSHEHSNGVNSLEFSPDGASLLTASDDGFATLLEVRTRGIVFSWEHPAPVYKALFSPDGAWIVTGGRDGLVRRFGSATGEPHPAALRHDPPVTAIAYSPDGRWIATASRGGSVRVWDAGTSQIRYPNLVSSPRHSLLQFSPDSSRLAASAYNDEATDVAVDWNVHVWDVASGTPITRPLVHDSPQSLAFSPDSRRLLTADVANVAIVWDLESGEAILRLPHSAPVGTAAFGSDGTRILTASGTGEHFARLWDATTGDLVGGPMPHEGRVIHAEFGPEGKTVLTVGREDRTIKHWYAPASAASAVSLPHASWVVSAGFASGGDQVLTATGGMVRSLSGQTPYATSEQNEVVIWSVRLGAAIHRYQPAKGFEAVTTRSTRLGTRALIAERAGIGSFAERARIVDVAAGNPIGEEIQQDSPIMNAEFSADGQWLATGSEDGVVVIWDARTANRHTRLVHGGAGVRPCFSVDGHSLLTTSSAGTAVVWEVVSGRRLAGPLEHQGPVGPGRFSPSGSMVVTTSPDFTARIWSLAGALLATFHHRGPVEYAEFSPDETLVMTASGDRTARIWSVATGKPLVELRHGGVVLAARFSPDGLRAVTVSRDGTAQLWDVATGLKLGDPNRHEGWVVWADFSPDNRRMITASLDRTARVWPVPVAPRPIPEWLPPLAEAVGGQRLNPDRLLEPVPWSDDASIHTRLTELSARSRPTVVAENAR